MGLKWLVDFPNIVWNHSDLQQSLRFLILLVPNPSAIRLAESIEGVTRDIAVHNEARETCPFALKCAWRYCGVVARWPPGQLHGG